MSTSNEQGYKDRTRAVRAEAQAKLRALREARQSRGGKRHAPTPAPAAEMPLDVADESGVMGITPSAEAQRLSQTPSEGALQSASDASALTASPAVEETPVEEGVAAVKEAVSDSELASLPGAGPGLVWALQKCGVHSMKDLAESDPEILTQRLNLIGQLLDLKGWIRMAQSHVESEKVS